MPVALRRVTPAVIQSIQVFSQVVLYTGLFIFAQCLVSWLHLPLPVNLVGMILMLALIVCYVLPLQQIRIEARWLLAGILLLFVPAVTAMIDYVQLLLVDGWRIFVVIALSTVMVPDATAWIVKKVYRCEMRRLNRG